LAQTDFLDVLNRAVDAAGGGQAAKLCLEVTEGALKFDLDAAWAMLRHTKELGVSLALDDFGTGNSSIKSVRTFKCEVLKIDKIFIDGLGMAKEDTAIVQHVIALAHDLGMIAVAEGVETAEQVAELRRLHCHRAQGYYFGRPMPPGAIDDLLYDASNVKYQPAPSTPLPQRGVQAAPEVLMAGASPAPGAPQPPQGVPSAPPPPPSPPGAAPSPIPPPEGPIQRDAPRPHEPQPLMAPRKPKVDEVVVPAPGAAVPRRRSELI
jgi:hypothetical protein